MEREELEQKYGQVWNTEELTATFSVEGFMAPFAVVIRKEDNVKGAVEFQHHPRYYYDFREA